MLCLTSHFQEWKISLISQTIWPFWEFSTYARRDFCSSFFFFMTVLFSVKLSVAPLQIFLNLKSNVCSYFIIFFTAGMRCSVRIFFSSQGSKKTIHPTRNTSQCCSSCLQMEKLDWESSSLRSCRMSSRDAEKVVWTLMHILSFISLYWGKKLEIFLRNWG